jgi:hypothetical protein
MMQVDSTNHRSADDPGLQSQTRRSPRGVPTPCQARRASNAVRVGRCCRGVEVRGKWGKRLEGDMKKPHEYMATAFR